MANYQNLRIHHLAMQQLQSIARITDRLKFGDLANQLRRAGISVVSNIVEGTGLGTDREFARFLRIARASNNEVAVQLTIAHAFGAREAGAGERNAVLGRMLTALIERLEGSG